MPLASKDVMLTSEDVMIAGRFANMCVKRASTLNALQYKQCGKLKGLNIVAYWAMVAWPHDKCTKAVACIQKEFEEAKAGRKMVVWDVINEQMERLKVDEATIHKFIQDYEPKEGRYETKNYFYNRLDKDGRVIFQWGDKVDKQFGHANRQWSDI